MRKKLKDNEKKVKINCTINPEVYKKVVELHDNVSKHIEWLLYQDLRKSNNIDEIPL